MAVNRKVCSFTLPEELIKFLTGLAEKKLITRSALLTTLLLEIKEKSEK